MCKFNKKEIKDAIVGMVLGDGSLRKRGNSVMFVMCHSNKQKEYVIWKNKILSQLTRIRINEYSPKNSYCDNRQLICSSSMAHPLYRDIYNLLYVEGVKRITKKALNYITPLSLSILWMDDGNLYHHFKKCNKSERCMDSRIGKYRSAGWDATLCTEFFPLQDQELLSDHINKVFNVKFRINKIRGKFRLRTNGTEFEKLIKHLSPYIINSMRYKIDKNSDWHPQLVDGDIVRTRR